MIYLDNAATGGKKPNDVIKSMQNAMLNYSANPGRSGHKLSMDTAFMVYSVRSLIKDFFGASSEENIAFVLNCTQAINTVVKGVVKRGDHIIVSSLEHNAVMRPINKLATEHGITYDIATVEPEDKNATADNFEKLIKPNTKLIICNHASNVFGCVQPIEEIGEIAKKHGIRFCVDAAQTGGVLKIDMQRQHIDYLCLAPHKGLFAPMGIGVLIAEKPIEHTLIEGGTGTESLNIVQPESMPERLESGTMPVAAIAGLLAGIKYINKIGITRIYEHEMNLCGMLYDNLRKIDKVQLYTSRPEKGRFVPVISFNVDGFSSNEVAEYLNKHFIAVRPGLHCAPNAHRQFGTLPDGTVRVSFGSFNTVNDVVSLYKSLKNL